jgi:hypothetical protein
LDGVVGAVEHQVDALFFSNKKSDCQII